ncbi:MULTISPECIES: PadR family transcriptional regulator [unclassified Microbacterium]|uniref:PadR family transcriptional regulator n=1 Tax=unclassified Microbacterium TaxID=2609290 RepID=UPI00386C324E
MATEMREPTVMVLASLADGAKHGYALIEETERISEGRVRLKVGTLYAVLDRLEQEGLVHIVREETVNGRLRRYFDLTDAGESRLAAEVERLEVTAREAKRRLALRPSFGGGVA